MGYTDFQQQGGGASADVPGTGSNTSAIIHGVGSELAAIPIRLKKAPVAAAGGNYGYDISPGGLLPKVTPRAAPAEDPANLTTYDSAVGKLGMMDADVRSQYQLMMWEAGIYGPNDTYNPGEYDEVSQTAWEKVVQRAAAQEISLAEVLEIGKQSVNDSGGLEAYYKGKKASTAQPLVTRLTNPDDLRMVAQEVATKRLGRNFTDAEITQFVNAYHGTETAASRGAYGAAQGKGGAVTAEASPEAAATAYAQSEHPTEYAATAQVKVLDKIKSMLAGGPGPKAGSGIGTSGV
jgi:hypothetical protein